MPAALPEFPGVTHDWVELPTGVRMHVAQAGKPDAPALVLQHGWPQHWAAWRDVIPLLADDYRLILPDLRGFGWSGQPADGDFRKQRLADDALALLDALGIERAGWVGHDWGGWTGFLVAERAPERLTGFLALNIVQPWQPPQRMLVSGWRFWYQWLTAAPGLGPAVIRSGGFTRLLMTYGVGKPLDPEQVRSYVEVLREPERAQASSLLYRDFILRDAPSVLFAPPGQIRVPVRVLFGTKDLAIDYRMLRGIGRHADDVHVELVRDCGHFIVDELPELVASRARELFR